MPLEILIIAGPNGAGKTTFASEYLPAQGLAFVNSDEIARTMHNAASQAQRDIRAARLLLVRLDALAQAKESFVFETTLATLSYVARIRHWRAAGYDVGLIYLRLPSAESSISRVQRRVAAGGHDIPEPTLRRRFVRSRDYLEAHYKPIVNSWAVYDSLEGNFRLAETGQNP